MAYKHEWIYQCEVVSVYDGDTIRVNMDFGMGFWYRGADGKGVQLRLARINTPEVRGVIGEKKAGLEVRDYVRSLILGKKVWIKTVKNKTGKFGRYVAEVILEDGTNLNDKLLSEGRAEPYDEH